MCCGSVSCIRSLLLVVNGLALLSDRLNSAMNRQVTDQYQGEAARDAMTQAWNVMHIQFDCCGADGYMDWRGNPLYEDTQKVPVTCCKGFELPWSGNGTEIPGTVDVVACLGEATIPRLRSAVFLNVHGCHEPLIDWIKERCVIVMALAFSFLLIEVAVIWASFNLKSKSDEWKQVA